MATTEQVDKPHPNGELPNPSGKGGFGDNPQNRNPGGWKKEMVFSYQYRRFMNMTTAELKEYSSKPDTERTVVEDLAYSRVIAAKKSLPDVREITDRTEGKAPQFIGLGDESAFKRLMVEFVGDDGNDGDSPDDSDT
jgi:hypothetical protein